MADSKITALTAISTVDPTADPLVIVDVSDTSMAASGTTKKSTINQLLGSGGTATFASATITGAASAAGLSVTGSTIPTNGVYLPSANSLGFAYNSTLGMTLNSTGLGVGISPSYKLNIGAANPTGGNIAQFYNNATSSLNGAYCLITQFGVQDWYMGQPAGVSAFTIGTGTTSKTEFLRVDASGNLSVGATAALNSVRIFAERSGGSVAGFNRTTSDGTNVLFYRQGSIVGDVSVTTTGTTFNSTSDYRLKEDVQPLVGGLARVSALKPSIYKWKSNGSSGEGFLAHELAEVVPAAVSGEKDAVNEDGSIKAQSIDMSRVVPILVAAIQELTARVQTLETR